jgi:hypothetical protein
MMKVASLCVLFIGEALCIYAEMLAAKARVAASLVVIMPSSLLLLAGYYYGYKAFDNIWIVTVASVTSILIAEPVLALALFSDTPSKGATAGLILGAIGLYLAVNY